MIKQLWIRNLKSDGQLFQIRVITKLPKGKSKLIIIQTDKISQQPENCEHRNDPDLVQGFLKKWCVKSDFKAPNLPLSLRFKGSGCHTCMDALKKTKIPRLSLANNMGFPDKPK